MVHDLLALRPGDIIRFDCTFVGDTDHFSLRLDYTAARKGGYQVFEGDLSAGFVHPISPVLGRGRVTPRRPLVPTEPVQTQEAIEDEKRRQNIEMEFGSGTTFDDDRTT
jgi:hypothetical protein